jgi:chitinase
MPATNIDFATVTHLIHFSVVPNPDGSLDSSINGVSVGNSADVVSGTHAAGRKVLICVGGSDSESGFQGATSSANLPAFLGNLTNFMATRGYDGVDLDWEPLHAADAAQFTNLVNGLRSALNRFPQVKLLTAAVGAYQPYGDPPDSEYPMVAAVQNQFDQINIMTYDMSGAWSGWVTWFNSPMYDGGYRFPSTGGLVPSVDAGVNNYLGNGVAAGKLGLGIPFYGYLWTGGSGVWQPRQSWPATNAPTVSSSAYSAIMSGYYQSNLYRWDTDAQAAYLSITNVNPTNDMFISYDDQRASQAKISYARNHGLGGMMIWELALDYFAAQPGGQRNPLLEAVKQGLATPGLTAIQLSNQQVNLSFTSLPLGSYRVEWTSNLTAGVWNTLAVTNVSGSGGLLQVTDPDPATQPQRFYRVQTPP